jgi:sugar phosphate isomerase/epimerase
LPSISSGARHLTTMAERTIGLAALTVLELSPPDMVDCAAAAGFDCVGLRLLPATPNEPQHDIVGDTPLVRETARRLAANGMPVLDVEIFRLKPGTNVADFRAALETAARFGAREALVAGQDADFARLVDTFGRFCDLAREYGIATALEPMPWCEVDDVDAGVRVLEAAGRPDAGLVLDAIHVDRAGTTPQRLRALQPRHIRYVQLCDAPAARPGDLDTLLHQAREARLMPGDGGLDLRGMLRALPGDAPISLEIPMKALSLTTPAVPRTRAMLAKARALLAEAGS